MGQQNNNKITDPILRALTYSDIFDYPLTLNQIVKYQIGAKYSYKKISDQLMKLVRDGMIVEKSNLFFLNGREKNLHIYKNRKKESIKKWDKAREAVRLLKFIPTLKFIGVSGSLSMNNAGKHDDIDLFFITAENTLWMSRALVCLILFLKGIKRNKSETIGIDKICPNMFLSESNLAIERNIFTAHEIAQLAPVLNRNLTYEKFLNENRWVKDLLPNAFDIRFKTKDKRENLVISNCLGFIDRIFFVIQYLYMRRHITIEKISQNSAKFHPKDKTKFVTDLYKKRYKTYKKRFEEKSFPQPQNEFWLGTIVTPGY